MTFLKLSQKDKKLLSQIQRDLPLTLTPFAEIARKSGWEENRLLRRIRIFTRKGMIRRFGAILRHQKAGFRGNAMVVWNVPEDLVPRVSRAMASFPSVSHCYLRPRVSQWPFNLYTMVHGRDERDCRRIAREIASRTGLTDYRILLSKREHKKSSMHYF